MLFFVVNATTEPTTLLGVANDVLRGGSCPIPTRIGAKAQQTPAVPAVPSLPGAVTAPDVRFVAYGAATTTPAPPGWIFPSPCSGVADTAKYARFSGATCVDPNAVLFGLDRLNQVDQWQFNTVQGGLSLSTRKQTWRNGTPSGPSTCTPGAICPTRTLLVPQGGAGFGWGGLVSLTSNPYAAPLSAFDKGAVNLFRDQAHEYFHGLQETWKKAVGNAALYNHVYFGESSADYSATNACVTDYPSDGVTTLPFLLPRASSSVHGSPRSLRCARLGPSSAVLARRRLHPEHVLRAARGARVPAASAVMLHHGEVSGWRRSSSRRL